MNFNWIKLKRYPHQTALPTITEAHRGQLRMLSGDGAATTDALKWGRNSAGTNAFVELVTDTDAQTLANKTLSAPVLIGANSPQFFQGAQSTSDVASTASTANYQASITVPCALVAGTWTVSAVGGVQLLHSAGGNVNFQINIDGIAGSERTLAANATTYTMFVTNSSQTGRTGTINVTVRFKSNTAGTTTARNPWLFITAERTA